MFVFVLENISKVVLENMEGDSMWESIILCILIAAEFLLQYYYWLQRQSATTRQACGHYSSFIVGMTKAMKCSESLNSKMLGWVSMLINLATENRTDFDLFII